MGKCPGCGKSVGPFSILLSWDNWGKFVCPGCGQKIRFQGWLLTVVVLGALFIGAERLLHWMLISHVPPWASFLISFAIALLIMFIVPMMWTYKKNAT